MADMTSSAVSVDVLLDERHIHRALSRFARLADTKDFDSLTEVFADDIEFDYGAGHLEQGIAALRTLLTRHLDKCGPTQHLIGSIIVDVDGNRADSKAYVQARHQRQHAVAGPVFDTCGEYLDTWERRPHGWRIVCRRAVWALTTGDSTILAG